VWQRAGREEQVLPAHDMLAKRKATAMSKLTVGFHSHVRPSERYSKRNSVYEYGTEWVGSAFWDADIKRRTTCPKSSQAVVFTVLESFLKAQDGTAIYLSSYIKQRFIIPPHIVSAVGPAKT